MAWGHLGSGCLRNCMFLKSSPIVSLVSEGRNIINIIIPFEFRQFLFYLYHSNSSESEPEAGMLDLFNESTNELVVEVFHSKVIKNGTFQNLPVGNHLLSRYVKCQNLALAIKVFDEFTEKDVRTWTILVSGFSRIGSSRTALDFFTKMQNEGVYPNQFTLSTVLRCCSGLNELRIGKGIHGWMVRSGVSLDVVLENSILDLYVKCGSFLHAEKLFELMAEKDTVSWNIMIDACLLSGDMKKSLELFRKLPVKDAASWNTIIAGHMQNGFERTALELFYQMVANGPAFNKHTFSIALALVSSLFLLKIGKQIHGRVYRIGIHNNHFIRDSLINVYCKCGKMEKASSIFKTLPLDMVETQDYGIAQDAFLLDTVSCSSIVTGYVHSGRWEQALKFFNNMVFERISVDAFTLTSIVSACASAGILELGRQIHAYIQKIGHKLDVFLGSSIIDMYCKCGSLDDARLIFRQTNDWNVVLWTSMISGCALHGQGSEAVSLFEAMLDHGIRPNEVTFVGILTACSHTGMLEAGHKYFVLMKEAYGIKPRIEHFTCMVDLFGRAGHFNEAQEFIYNNGLSHLSAVWRAFLSSCQIHKNTEMGRWVSEKLLKLEPCVPEPYILLSNLCANNQKWEEAANLRGLMQEKGIKKQPGQSWVHLKNQLHSFIAGDRSHPQEVEIYSYLDKLIRRVKELGYSNDTEQVMQDVEEEQKEVLLGFHSEKLAVAYAIMSTTGKMPIRIMKNLRVCADCHNFIKYTSLLLGREIVVRDIHRFHHFKNGHCSCGDYW